MTRLTEEQLAALDLLAREAQAAVVRPASPYAAWMTVVGSYLPALLAEVRAARALPESGAPPRSCLWHADCDAADRALRAGVSPSHPPREPLEPWGRAPTGRQP